MGLLDWHPHIERDIFYINTSFNERSYLFSVNKSMQILSESLYFCTDKYKAAINIEVSFSWLNKNILIKCLRYTIFYLFLFAFHFKLFAQNKRINYLKNEALLSNGTKECLIDKNIYPLPYISVEFTENGPKISYECYFEFKINIQNLVLIKETKESFIFRSTRKLPHLDANLKPNGSDTLFFNIYKNKKEVILSFDATFSQSYSYSVYQEYNSETKLTPLEHYFQARILPDGAKILVDKHKNRFHIRLKRGKVEGIPKMFDYLRIAIYSNEKMSEQVCTYCFTAYKNGYCTWDDYILNIKGDTIFMHKVEK